MSEKPDLKNLRASLAISQYKLAESAKISVPALVDIEKKRSKPHLKTAYSIIDVLNAELKAKGREEITISDIDWEVGG